MDTSIWKARWWYGMAWRSAKEVKKERTKKVQREKCRFIGKKVHFFISSRGDADFFYLGLAFAHFRLHTITSFNIILSVLLLCWFGL